MAEAIPASCESERCTSTAPSSAARAATVPRRVNSGRPDSSETTSASCHAMFAGAPSALASASLAANLAASEATGSPASAAVNSRSASPGVRRSESSKRDRSTTSMPTPTIATRAVLLDRDGLGEVAGLVDVMAEPGGELAGEQLQRYDGRHRLHQRRDLGQPDDRVGELLDADVVLLGQHDRAGTARPDLLDRADHLVVELVAALRRHDAEDRQPGVAERDRPVLELAGRETLGMDVGELLELERTLERDREARVPTEEQHGLRTRDLLRESVEVVGVVEDP